MRDSDQSLSQKAVAHTLSTYMNGEGTAFPSRETLAAGASCNVRTVDAAIMALEDNGFLRVKRSKGRSPNFYRLAFPTANDVLGSTAKDDRRNSEPVASNSEPVASNSEPGSPEDVESDESVSGLDSETARQMLANHEFSGWPREWIENLRAIAESNDARDLPA